MSTAKLIAEKDIREDLARLGKTFIRTSLKTLIEYRILLYEVSR